MPRRYNFRSAFTLTEAIVVVVVLAIAVPPTVSAFRDASLAGVSHRRTVEAETYACAILETILSDVYADTSSINFDGIASPSYEADLPARLAGLDRFYGDRGFTFDLTVSARVGHDGRPAAPGSDLYRYVTVIVSHTAGPQPRELARASLLVADMDGAKTLGGNQGNQGGNNGRGNGRENRGNGRENGNNGNSGGNGNGNNGNGNGNGGGNGTGNEGNGRGRGG